MTKFFEIQPNAARVGARCEADFCNGTLKLRFNEEGRLWLACTEEPHAHRRPATQAEKDNVDNRFTRFAVPPTAIAGHQCPHPLGCNGKLELKRGCGVLYLICSKWGGYHWRLATEDEEARWHAMHPSW